MLNFLKKLPGKIFRVLIGRDKSVVAILLRTLAEDFLRSFLRRNPSTKVTLTLIAQISEQIAALADVNISVAERVVQATLHRLDRESLPQGAVNDSFEINKLPQDRI